jgi:CRISPR system Cascade subunit CasE
MYLSRLQLNTSRIAVLWASNPYRVHQRLMMACDGDPRLLFRIEDTSEGTQILVQSHVEPNWTFAFSDLDVLRRPPEHKAFDLRLQAGRHYRFRLLANPTAVKTTLKDDGEKDKSRLGLFKEEDQRAWLTKKLEAGGAKLVSVVIMPRGLQKSGKNPAKDEHAATHLAVLFEGVLQTQDAEQLKRTVEGGIGPAKGYGFGLLSLAPT